MPKNIRDVLKRNVAQSLNNSAKSILDLNVIYDEFLPVHPEQAAVLGQAMMEIAHAREVTLLFVKQAWELDDDGIMAYLG